MRSKLVFLIAALATSFAMGRYTSQKPTMTEHITTSQQDAIKTNKDVEEKIIVVKKPDGETTTTITKKDRSKIVEDDKITRQTDIAVIQPPRTNLSVLMGTETLSLHLKPVYGVSLTRQVLGPITIGIFSLTNTPIGVSLGITF